MKFQLNHERGSVLATTLVLTGLVTIVVAALLVVVHRQNYFTARSQIWCSEIPIAEAGVEEAMAHLSSRPVQMTNNGWKLDGSNYVKARYFTNAATIADGYFYTAISTARPPTIVSIGYGRIPLQTNYTHRTVAVTTKRSPLNYAIIAKTNITMGGSGSDTPWVDSFDSTKGPYSLLTRGDEAAVGTWSTANPAISTGSGEIYGYAATGPGGTVTGTVGDGTWNATTSGLQPDHTRDDFNMAIPDVADPSPLGRWVAPNLSTIGTYAYVLGSANYKYVGDMKLNTKGILVAGNARLWITGEFSISDAVTIMPGATLELYFGGPATFTGGGIVNGSATASACKVFGLPGCYSLKYSGSTALTGVVYAPQADVKMSGSSDLYGKITAYSFTCSGTMGIHYDEALGGNEGPPWTIASWEELMQ